MASGLLIQVKIICRSVIVGTQGAMNDLLQFFDRVYVINLQRRPDRLHAFQSQLNDCNWPFQTPRVFSAIDGDKVPCPPEFTEGSGAFGCRQSHLGVLQECLQDDVNSVFILEDDARLLPGFNEQIKDFLTNIPQDWEGLYFGGQHKIEPQPIKPGIVRAKQVERTHAYACRGRYLRALYARWIFSTVHIDWMMRAWQAQFRVYCPDKFLIAQGSSHSDINGRFNGSQAWNPATGNEPVICLQAPRQVAETLKQWGVHLGYHRDPTTGHDIGLQELLKATTNDRQERVRRLGEWIRCLQAETNAEPGTVCTVWHPECDSELVRAATKAQVSVIQAETLETALTQLPPELELTQRPSIARRFIVLLKAPNFVVRQLRIRGFHTGFWRDENDVDHGLAEIYRSKSGSERIEALSKWILLLQFEAEHMLEGVVVVWHPEAILSEIQAATEAQVIEIEAETSEEAWQLWQGKIKLHDIVASKIPNKPVFESEQRPLTNGKHIHLANEPNNAETNSVTRQSLIVAVVSVFDSPEMLPYFVQHYHRLGVDRLCISLNCDYNFSQLQQDYPGFVQFQRTNYECFKNSYKHEGEEALLNAEGLEPDDWVLHLDLDEFQQYPAHLRDVVEVAEARNIWAIVGNLYDRVSADGSLKPIEKKPTLDQQFPLGGWLTGPLVNGTTRKVMLCRRRVKLQNGRHDTHNARIDRWPIGNLDHYRVHHFRWTAGLLSRLETRWTETERPKYRHVNKNLAFCHQVRELGRIDLHQTKFEIKAAKLDYPQRHRGLQILAHLQNTWGLDAVELETLANFVRRRKIKTVLEFCCGYSTAAFLGCGCIVTSLEHERSRQQKYQQLFTGLSANIHFYESFSAISALLPPGAQYDLCFIDAPQGTPQDSRLAEVHLAAKHSKLIILHDSKRPGERQTIQKMQSTGWSSKILGKSKRGLTLLWKNEDRS